MFLYNPQLNLLISECLINVDLTERARVTHVFFQRLVRRKYSCNQASECVGSGTVVDINLLLKNIDLLQRQTIRVLSDLNCLNLVMVGFHQDV